MPSEGSPCRSCSALNPRARGASAWRAARATIDPAGAAITAGIVLLLAVAGWWLVRPARPPVEAGLPRASTTAEGAAGVGEESGPQAASDTRCRPGPPALAPERFVVRSPGRSLGLACTGWPTGPGSSTSSSAAGGALADADLQAMALAGRLIDGQRVQVPRMGEVLPLQATGGAGPAGTGGPGPTAPATPIDLNTASQPELEALPGIGPTTAQAILTYRDEHGPFASVDDLGRGPGHRPGPPGRLAGAGAGMTRRARGQSAM